MTFPFVSAPDLLGIRQSLIRENVSLKIPELDLDFEASTFLAFFIHPFLTKNDSTGNAQKTFCVRRAPGIGRAFPPGPVVSVEIPTEHPSNSKPKPSETPINLKGPRPRNPKPSSPKNPAHLALMPWLYPNR